MSPVNKKQKTSSPSSNNKELILSVILTGGPAGHWTHPDDRTHELNKLETWVEFAQLLERGKIHSLFIADHLAIYSTYEQSFKPAVREGMFVPRIDPSALVSALSQATESLNFGITFSTFSEHPYHFARRLTSLDHFSDGRVSWNIVTSFLKNVQDQLGGEFLKHDLRYLKAQEYLDVVYKLLLSSWRDDAVQYNKETGVFADPDLVREINHEGEWFKVPGPAISEPSRQRFPVIFQAGTSKAGKVFAAENAELVFVTGLHRSGGKEIQEIRDLAAKFGRDPYSIKFIAGATFHIGKTHDEALEKLAKQRKYFPEIAKAVGFSGVSDIDLSKYELDDIIKPPAENNAHQTITKNIINSGSGKTKRQILETYDRSGLFVGTPEEIVEQVKEYVDKYDVDGFNIEAAIFPTDIEDFVDLLVPELQKQGLFWKDYKYKGGTFRENIFGKKFLSEDHPAYGLKWDSSKTQEEFEADLIKVEKKRKETRNKIKKELGLPTDN
ncbi:hypothetical protein WICMUC_001786 [Wickerhamomyces mucosus]|uniref:Luciferase-like domain-containing protein n=1 Tax=Wickerhamomyces mucosus TaxID=1378264 RepID=A0A9P8PTB4_9ASCO|nr:hypothetical protein WICMUC_001786 [Wickerhamomyces mucosus]